METLYWYNRYRYLFCFARYVVYIAASCVPPFMVSCTSLERSRLPKESFQTNVPIEVYKRNAMRRSTCKVKWPVFEKY
jgi:hypothetical protein